MVFGLYPPGYEVRPLSLPLPSPWTPARAVRIDLEERTRAWASEPALTLATWVLTGVVLVGGLVFDLVTASPPAVPRRPEVYQAVESTNEPAEPTDDTYAIPSIDP